MDKENIESRLKDVMIQIKNDIEKDYDEKLRKEKEEVINNLLNMFPHLESKKSDIINECINKKDGELNIIPKKKPIKREDIDEMVFDQIKLEDKDYYVGQFQGVWNDKAELVGSLLGYSDDGTPNISFHNEKILTEIPEDLKKFLYKQ